MHEAKKSIELQPKVSFCILLTKTLLIFIAQTKCINKRNAAFSELLLKNTDVKSIVKHSWKQTSQLLMISEKKLNIECKLEIA